MLSIGLLMGAFAAANAKLPAAAPKSDAEKAAEAQKAAAAKTKDAELLNKAQERAAANYRKSRAADHSRGISPDHSSPARQSGESSGR
jgi:hypothetical protein